MDRYAVFVDAGYLFAQGSTALTGSKKPRHDLVLDARNAIEHFLAFARGKCPGCHVLRVYWYDGASGGLRPTSEQALVAHLDDVKLRLGFINSDGQQKGVDSLIVTDLIELARLNSISDAVLLSGDEDVRVGVQIAQNYGVRVHLLGISPSRGSQSQQLLQEADTTSEWNRETVSQFLSVRGLNAPAASRAEAGPYLPSMSSAQDVDAQIKLAVQSFVDQLADLDIQGVEAYWESQRGVPRDLDRKLLPYCGTALRRELERSEIQTMRSWFQRLVKNRSEATAPASDTARA